MENVVEFKRNKLSEAVKRMLGTVEAATKTLKLQPVRKNSDKRKLVISTNWLDLFSFTEGARVTEEVLGHHKGMKVELAEADVAGTKQVYGRGYKNRDRETLMDIRHQEKLNEAFGDAERVHIIFQKGQLVIVPVFEHQNNVISEGLGIKLHNEDGLYTGIIDAINLIKEKAFAEVSVEADKAFRESSEYTLFCMQLRRLGYELDFNEADLLVAKLPGAHAGRHTTLETSATADAPLSLPFNAEQPLATLSACTAGVDVFGVEADGFEVESILEYRPPEQRDFKKGKDPVTGEVVVTHADKSETGAISAAINSRAAKVVFNEDIYGFDVDRVASIMKRHNFFQISLQCDDFSNLKNEADRIKSIETLDSTRDMIFPALAIIEKTRIPTLLVENVKNFSSSVECKLFESRLRKLGYQVYKANLNAMDYNGYTRRHRSFVFATLLDAPFEFPAAVERTVHVWNDIIAPNMHMLRDVSHTKTVQKAIGSGRMRVINEGDAVAPTLTKSQSRQVKDSVYVKIGDRFFMPSNEMLKMLMGIAPEFDLTLFSGEIASEIIGQSVDIPMHHHISLKIKAHILGYAEKIGQRIAQNFSGNGAQLALF